MEDGCGNNLEMCLRAEGEFGNIFCEHIHDEASTFYPSPAAYFSALLTCLREGAFSVNEKAGQDGESLLNDDFDKVWEIHSRYCFG